MRTNLHLIYPAMNVHAQYIQNESFLGIAHNRCEALQISLETSNDLLLYIALFMLDSYICLFIWKLFMRTNLHWIYPAMNAHIQYIQNEQPCPKREIDKGFISSRERDASTKNEFCLGFQSTGGDTARKMPHTSYHEIIIELIYLTAIQQISTLTIVVNLDQVLCLSVGGVLAQTYFLNKMTMIFVV